MQIGEAVTDHKGEESAARVFIHVSRNSNSSFVSSLTKQRNKDFEVDLGSKSKDFDVGTNLMLSNMKLNSAKFNTCPLNQQKNVEYQPNCFSDSRKFGVNIQRDAIHLNLKTPENDLNSTKDSASILSSEKTNLSQSDAIQSCDKGFHNEMTCELPEGTESLHELQALQPAEATVTEVDDDITVTTDTPKQSEQTSVLNAKKYAAYVGPVNPISIESIDDVVVTDNNNSEINLSEWVSSYDLVQPSQNDDKIMAFPDEITHVNEDFIIDEEIRNLNMENNESRIDFDILEIPSTTIARASIIEQICKSASMQTPLSQFSSAFKQHQIQDLYGFVADGNHGILDHVVGTTISLDEDSTKHSQTSGSCITETDSFFPQHQKFSYGTPFSWQSKNHYSSPTGKLWERSASSSSSFEKQLSSHPDLTCFPIEEDPNSNEESENAEDVSDDLHENIMSKLENENSVRVSPKMTERTENDYAATVEIQEPPLESTELRSQQANLVSATSMKYLDRCSSNSVITEASIPRTRGKVEHKPKMHHGLKISTYEDANRNSSMITRASSRGNLSEISENKNNMRSGIARVSQNEGKRKIEVKSLKTAEATRRQQQDKENERRKKKEALNLERELKKKNEADIAAKKRLREEKEMKQLAKKRKIDAEAQKNQKLKSVKLRTGKVEMQKHATIAGNMMKSENLRQNKSAYENSVQKRDTELMTDKSLENVIQQVTRFFENCDACNDSGEKEKATGMHENSPVKIGHAKLTSQESSYDISPYRSDDEDEEEDDLPTKKFIPSWASKTRVAMVLPWQQKLNPEIIFIDSFCGMDEAMVYDNVFAVLLPRRLQGQ
ncbi:hypothetical protein SSX86_005949 [Deinandra increscens subsp. villosa]|uniref:Inner centromere protein ARK-binding domain-containing protein n=1 Tax=Deinandra increscens subsp. villosa TaxID=3103831 RepID=A0AAP0DRY9_9ASTR